MMKFSDIPRIIKGLFTTENVSDDEIKIAVSFIGILVVLIMILIMFI